MLSTLSFLVLKFSGLLRIGENIEKVGYDMHSHSPPKAYAFNGHDPKSSSSEESGSEGCLRVGTRSSEAHRNQSRLSRLEPMGVILSHFPQVRLCTGSWWLLISGR